jgi:hypothetical protein
VWIVVEEKLAVVKKLLTGRTVRFDIVEQPQQIQQLPEDLVKTEFDKKPFIKSTMSRVNNLRQVVPSVQLKNKHIGAYSCNSYWKIWP